jgi:hypothetical protein
MSDQVVRELEELACELRELRKAVLLVATMMSYQGKVYSSEDVVGDVEWWERRLKG